MMRMKRCGIRMLPAILIMGLSGISYMQARKIRTSHKAVKVTEEQMAADRMVNDCEIKADTTAAWKTLSEKIKFSGFDKTPSSNKESFFITNATDSMVKRMILELTYTDLSGRVLHERSEEVECNIPAGETRRVDIPTWDLQHAFRHYRCQATRRATTPFRVSIIPVSIAF